MKRSGSGSLDDDSKKLILEYGDLARKETLAWESRQRALRQHIDARGPGEKDLALLYVHIAPILEAFDRLANEAARALES